MGIDRRSRIEWDGMGFVTWAITTVLMSHNMMTNLLSVAAIFYQ